MVYLNRFCSSHLLSYELKNLLKLIEQVLLSRVAMLFQHLNDRVKLNHTRFCRILKNINWNIQHNSVALLKFGRSKLRMYVKTWLPSNPQQQLIYSIPHLVIALSNKNSTFPRRHLENITSILFECATCCCTSWMCHWKREWIKKHCGF